MRQSLRCWAEVDLDALRGNLAWIRHQAGPGRRVITVVKADAYGHGLRQIAALLMQSGTDMFGVANLAEARAIRAVGGGWPILMLGACLPEEIPLAVREGVRPVLSSVSEARWFAGESERQGRIVRAHVKIDTGMGRLGVAPAEAMALIRELGRLPGLRLEGLCTHFADAENDARFTARQQRKFEAVVQAVRAGGFAPEWVHASNSAGLLLQPPRGCNAVRAGLLVYGVVPPGSRLAHARSARHLRPALAWKTRVSHVKAVPAGATLSYGRTFKATRSMRVGTLAAGYGDGYLRSATGRAGVLIQGRRCRILGRITMDQMLVDLTPAPEVEPGEEAVLLGAQGGDQISANELAEWMGTIPWEVLTSIGRRVPRVYSGGHAA